MLAKFSIRAKITTLVAALLIAMSGLGALGIFKLQSMNTATIDIAKNWLPSVRILGELRYNVLNYRTALRNHMLDMTAEGKAGVEKRILELDDRIQKTQQTYEALISSPEE